MTLTTYRSPAARLLHAALELADRARRAMRVDGGPGMGVQALAVLEVAALRDMGIVPAQFESFGAQAGVESPSRFTPGAAARA